MEILLFLNKELGTALNRIVYASPPEGGLGYEKPQSGETLFAVLSPPQFGNPAKPTVSLIRVAKPSYTTRTLCAIGQNSSKRLTNFQKYV